MDQALKMPCPPVEMFQIGWICALPIEVAAAKEMLDEPFGILDKQHPSDSNAYTLGRIGKHHVVIACLSGGQYGTTSATAVAINMIRTFSKSLRIGLMVGVGGGIPSATHDIRLGDIVISCPGNRCGGVVQYDMGKVVAGGGFHRTGSLNSPPRALLTAVNLIRAAELTDDPQYPKYLLKAMGRNARTRKSFERPQEDRLFKLGHNHPAAARTCDGCLVEWEETRGQRETSDPQPHYGIIASGNAVIKDGPTREQLRLDTGALCLEMEAAGLMVDFPCIVVRGVCDYADNHKNDQWQGYAALAAASYAKELLGYVPIGHVSQENLVVDVCEVIKEGIKNINQHLHRVNDRQEQYHNEIKRIALADKQQLCHQSFSVANYEEQKNINPRRVRGTCQWALQSREYIRWRESNYNDLLWVSADPGCGKSVLARSIVDEFYEAPKVNISICYFFFKDNRGDNQVAAALCSALHQLFSQRPDLLIYATESWVKQRETLRGKPDELWKIFLTATSADPPHQTICVFDALDECCEDDQVRLIDKIQSFRSRPSTQSWLKVLVTSRPYKHIQSHFRTITESFRHLHLNGEEGNNQIRKEIDIVVKIRIKELAETTALSWKVQQRLEQQFLQIEHRTYLWLDLVIKDIRSTLEVSPWPAEEPIPTIPRSVDEAYEKILSRVPHAHINTVQHIFQIIVAARRSLTIREMAEILETVRYRELETGAQAKIDPNHLEQSLPGLCGLFVFINNSKIYLIHQTAREFLISRRNIRPERTGWWQDLDLQKAHLFLSKGLMAYLHDRRNLTEGKETSVKRNALLEYAATYWVEHVREARSLPIEALQRATNLCESSQVNMWARFAEPQSRPFTHETQPVFWATRWKLEHVANMLLRDPEFNITDVLLQAAADPLIGDTVIRLLLDQRGDEVIITDEVIQTSVQNRARGLPIMELFLGRRKHEIRITEEILRKAAKNTGSGFSIIKLLLDQPKNAIKITSTVMEEAAGNTRDGADIIKYLLDREGVEPKITPRVIRATSANIPPEREMILHLLRSRSYKFTYMIKKTIPLSQGRQRCRAISASKWDR